MDNGWISVEERLPDKSCRCIVTNGENVNFDFYESDLAVMYGDPIKGFERWHPSLGGITHWMPLPAPPSTAPRA